MRSYLLRLLTILCVLNGFFASVAKGKDAPINSGIETATISASAPKETAHWGQLVGNWNVTLEEMTTDGDVDKAYEGEWNFFYTLGGIAIQDVFILPPRSANIPPDQHFFGTGIRIYDAESGQWRIVWIDSAAKEFELRDATSTPQEIVMKTGDGSRRWVYFDLQDNSFQWRQENLIDGEWNTDQRIRAIRVKNN